MNIAQYIAALSFKQNFLEQDEYGDTFVKGSWEMKNPYKVYYYAGYKVVHFDKYVYAVFYNGEPICEEILTMAEIKKLRKIAHENT